MAKARKGGGQRPLTVKGIDALKPGEWGRDPAPRGAGRLEVRKLVDGDAAYYYRYTNPAGGRERIALGTGLMLAAARDKVAELSLRYQAGDQDLKAALDAEAKDERRQQEAKERQLVAAAERAKATLGALLDAYAAQLRRNGRKSATAVQNSLHANVKVAFPKLWGTPVEQITTDDLLPIVSKLANEGGADGSGRITEARKVRSYLVAAFTSAKRARHDARAIQELRQLGVTSNPASDLAPIEGARKAKERALSVAELRAYWKRIVNLPDHDGAALRFHLLTGGQRMEMLAAATRASVNRDEQTLLLLDWKGRRTSARRHLIPLSDEALHELDSMNGGSLGEFVFTANGGQSGLTANGMAHRLAPVVAAMLSANELPSGPFTPGDIRRTVETRLAALGVSQEVRAQLQSHGLSGVQAVHYDKHDYLDEKRDALERLYRLVSEPDGEVVTLSRQKAKAAKRA